MARIEASGISRVRLGVSAASALSWLGVIGCSAAGDASLPPDGSGGLSGIGAAVSSGGSPIAAGGDGGVFGAGGSGGIAGVAGASGGGGMPAGGGVSSTGGSPAAGGAAGEGGTAGGTPPPYSPVYRIALRVHMGGSNLTNAELGPVLAELNDIWLSQAGICFESEVTNDETNMTTGFDFRYVSGPIPGAPTANGLTQGPHAIWSIDHPSLGSAPNPVMNPAARTTAHELGHALNLDHENQPPSTDCASPCYCVTLALDCDDFLMRSGRKGFFLSDPEVQIARARAAQRALADTSPLTCAPPVFNR